MKNKINHKTSCLLSLLLTSFLSLPSSANADDRENLRVKLDALNSVQADFSQKVTDINDKLIQEGQGQFALAQPNQFYWHLTQPDESLIVADGKAVWIYNPFAEEVTVLDLDDAIKASPIALMVNKDEKTWAKYTVKQTNECFVIAPKISEGQVTDVTVCFEGSTLTHFSLADEQGNLSEFKLTNQQPVTATQSTLFSFTIPEDTDVDDQRRAQN